MQTILMTHAGPSTGPSNSALRYGPFGAGNGASTWSTGLSSANVTIPIAGTIGNIVARFPVSITTGSYQLSLMVNDVAVLSGTISTGTSLTVAGTASIAAGDRVCWRLTPTSTPDTQTVVQIGCTFDSTTPGKSLLFSSVTTGTTEGYIPFNSSTGPSGTDIPRRCVFPTGGVIDEFRVRLSAAPGTTTSRTFTLYKNGAPTGLTVTLGSGDTTGTASGTSVSFSAGEYGNIRCEHTAGTPATSFISIGTVWTPTISGEGLIFGLWTSSQDAAAARVTNINGSANGSQSTASNVYNIAPAAFTLRKVYAMTDVAPGASKSRAVQVQVSGATQSTPIVTIDGSETTDFDTTNTLSVSSGDLLNWIVTPSGTPTANTALCAGAVAFTGSAATGNLNDLLLLGVG